MEAAIVLPVIIMVTITVILVVLFFYSQSVSQSRMHMALRCEAGRVSGNTVCSTGPSDDSAYENWDGNIEVSGSGFFKEVTGSKALHMTGKGVLRQRESYTVSGCCHAADGVKYVRLFGRNQ